jgi:hypothetical protein
MTVGSGRQSSMLLEQSSPLGCCSKILLESSLWTSSAEYSYVWNRLDTRFGLSAFQLTPLGLNTDDSGSSLWPTATAVFSESAPNRDSGINLATATKLWPTPRREGFAAGCHNGKPDSLHAAAKLWPTPTVPNGGRRNPEGTSITGKKPNGGKAQIDLLEFAIRMLPTPTVQCGKNNASPSQYNRNSDPLDVVAAKMSGCVSGSLNPRFVEELMGFEIDHTALKPSATPSCRSKRSPFSRPLPKLKG